MRTKKVWFATLAAMFLMQLTSVWAHAGSLIDGAQGDASKTKTAQKKGNATASQGGSTARVGQNLKSPRDSATGQASGKRLWKPVPVHKEPDEATAKLTISKATDSASPKLGVTKLTDQASPKLAVTKPTDKASPGTPKHGSTAMLSASPTPAPAIKKGTAAKR